MAQGSVPDYRVSSRVPSMARVGVTGEDAATSDSPGKSDPVVTVTPALLGEEYANSKGVSIISIAPASARWSSVR